jgi:hypothetical protein
MARQVAAASFIFFRFWAKTARPVSAVCCISGKGNFSDGDHFLQEETGTLWNFFSVFRTAHLRISADS